MMITFVPIIIIFIYFSLVIEIAFFSVPSVASTYQLVSHRTESRVFKGLFGKVLRLSFTRKFFLCIVPGVLSTTAFCLPLLLVAFPGLNGHVYPIPDLKKDAMVLFGILLMITGRVISVSAVPVIRKQKGYINTDSTLITKGIFRFSRNPIALGMIVTLLGLFLTMPSVVLFIGWLIYAGNMHFRILLEEDFMKYRFGHRYTQYRMSTRRYF